MTGAPGGASSGGGSSADDVRGRRGPLADVDLAIFDKDGTLIDFHLMWSDWVRALADGLAGVTGDRSLDDVVYATLGVDDVTGRVDPHGALAAVPMARIRDSLRDAIRSAGLDAAAAEQALTRAWHSPDPVVLAREVTDLRRLFRRLRASGTRIAVATSDDRGPTERTLAHLGLADLVDRVACADDGRPVKPFPHAVHWICAELGVPAERTAMIGDSPADLAMGRAAGVGLVVGVLTGVGDERMLTELADLVVPSVEALAPPD